MKDGKNTWTRPRHALKERASASTYCCDPLMTVQSHFIGLEKLCRPFNEKTTKKIPLEVTQIGDKVRHQRDEYQSFVQSQKVKVETESENRRNRKFFGPKKTFRRKFRF